MLSQLNPPVRGLIMDLDGVLWRDNQPLGDLPAIFARIRELNLKVALLSNNATRFPEVVQKKLLGFGVDFPLENIITSPMAVGFLLRQRFPAGGPIYVVGEAALMEPLRKMGYPHTDNGSVLAVVAGLDRTITYEKLSRASLLVRSGGPFIGSNPDLTYPAAEGEIPGSGTILAAIEAASGRKPVIAGKPSPALFQLALERLGTRPEETLMIGDRLDTDILGGQRVGCQTALVLTGVSTAEEAARWDPPPTLVAESLSQLIIG